MPCDIRADTDLTIAPASRSCVPSCLAMRAQRPRNCLDLFRMKLPAACCGELAKENIMTIETRTPNPRRTPSLPHDAQCTWSSGGGRISFSRLSCSICCINAPISVHPAPSTAGIQRARK